MLRRYAFGNNDYGMLGTNDLTQRLVPTFITLLRGANVNFLSSGGYHTLASPAAFISGCRVLVKALARRLDCVYAIRATRVTVAATCVPVE